MVLQHTYPRHFLMTCDECSRLETVSTAKTVTRARQVAKTSFSWEMETPFGDLCRRCARNWHLGYLGNRPS
jgi:hypothetical protein